MEWLILGIVLVVTGSIGLVLKIQDIRGKDG
jgi:hypothetical protein